MMPLHLSITSFSEDEGGEGENRNAFGNNTVEQRFNSKWNWTYLVNQVSDVTKETWDGVYQMPIVVFLNIACYLRDKNEFEKASLHEYKSGNIKRYG